MTPHLSPANKKLVIFSLYILYICVPYIGFHDWKAPTQLVSTYANQTPAFHLKGQVSMTGNLTLVTC
jgi:hypothetical protein